MDLPKLRRDLQDAVQERELLDDYVRALSSLIARHDRSQPSADRAVTGSVARGTRVQRQRRGGTRDAVLSIMGDGQPHRVSDVAEQLGKSVNATSAAVRALRDLGTLEQDGYGTYRLKPAERSTDAANLLNDLDGAGG